MSNAMSAHSIEPNSSKKRCSKCNNNQDIADFRLLTIRPEYEGRYISNEKQNGICDLDRGSQQDRSNGFRDNSEVHNDGDSGDGDGNDHDDSGDDDEDDTVQQVIDEERASLDNDNLENEEELNESREREKTKMTLRGLLSIYEDQEEKGNAKFLSAFAKGFESTVKQGSDLIHDVDKLKARRTMPKTWDGRYKHSASIYYQ